MPSNWDKIITGPELAIAKNSRAKTFVTKKDRKSALPELLEEGWVEYKELKNPKFVIIKKDKKSDEQFEDKVWSIFANMAFTDLNGDRNFKMQYDFSNPNITQQIDVFAADEETIIIVECKTQNEIKEATFKTAIEAYHGKMEGLRKEATKQYPGRKVKFIWATNNCIMNQADLNKLKEWNIAHFNETSIEYYTELIKHLGSAAKYQLLGFLFANQEIKNMENKIPAIKGKMGGHTYYSFSIEPEKLLKIGYVLHRNEANKSMMPTYQRLIKKKRLTEVQRFIENNGYFPNSIIVSLDAGGKDLVFENVDSKSKVDSTIAKLGILHLPKKYRSAYIIDGQHRLYGYSDSPYASTNTIPVVAFVDLDRKSQIELFMDINENQKAVSKTLRVTLNSDLLWVSDDYQKRRHALRSKVAQKLGEESTSPLLGRVVIGEENKTETKCITVEAIQSALGKCDFFSSFGKKNLITKDGTFDTGDIDDTCDKFYPFIEACFRYIKINLSEEWDKGDRGVLTINRSIHGLIRVINDVVNFLVYNKQIAPKGESYDSFSALIEKYLNPLIKFIRELTEEQRKGLKGSLGGGADTRYWRVFQKVIADEFVDFDDFNPYEMHEWWDKQSKVHNNESMALIAKISTSLKMLIRDKLSDYYGDEWELDGIPKDVARRLHKIASEINTKNKLERIDVHPVEPWECVTIDECRAIVTSHARNWSDIFASVLSSPYVNPSSNKHEKTAWIKDFAVIEKKNLDVYSISQLEYDLLTNIHKWFICNNAHEEIQLEL